MTKRLYFGGAAGAVLMLSTMPAMACPRQHAAVVSAPAPRVHVVATADGYAIAESVSVSAAGSPAKAIPLGAQMQIDRDAFECSTRRLASARP